MENKKSLFVLLACALFASVLATETLAPSTEVPSTPPSGSSTSTTADNPTTPPSSTTTPSSTTDPVPPTTPATTTPAPTTPAPVPTTPAPTPSPFPDSLQKGNWTVSGDNVTCILAAMAVSAKIKYPLQGSSTKATLEKTVFVPSLAKAEGSCDPIKQWIKLTWGNNSMQVEFKKNDTKMYFISQITYSLFADSNVFKNISTELANKQFSFMRVKHDYMVNLNQSFHCTREQNLTLSNNGSDINAELFLSSVQLQAFHLENTDVFGAPQYCELDTPDIVPIAVGCALAALVIVVLVAYLVGRRRSQARGYLSM